MTEGMDAPATSAKLQEVVERLKDRVDEVADAMLVAYQEEIGPYAGIDATRIIAEVRGMSHLNVLVLLHCIGEQRGLTEQELGTLRELGRRRSTQGFPLHALLRAYQVGTRVSWGVIFDEVMKADIDSEMRPELLGRMSQLVLQLASQVTESVAQAYLETEREAATVEEKTRRDVVDQLLGGDIASSEVARRRAGSVGFTLGSTHVAAAVALEGARENEAAGAAILDSIARAAVAEIGTGSSRPIIASLGPGIALVFPDITDNRSVARTIERALAVTSLPPGLRAIAGIGCTEPGALGIHASYRQAQNVLDVLRMTEALPLVMTYEAMLPYILLSHQQAVALDIYRATIEPLLAHDPDLVHTIEVYLETGGNSAKAAKRLFVHRHTLYDRIARIEEMTGRSLDDGADRLLFELGVRALRLLPAEVAATAMSRTDRSDKVSTPLPSNTDKLPVSGRNARK